jgi:uncharacterized protein (TIGR03435 family)
MAALQAGTAAPQCGQMSMLNDHGLNQWIVGGETIPGFAGTLSTFMDRRVLDKTGLDTQLKYNVRLSFRRDEHVPGPDKRFGPPTSISEVDGPTIFQALEQQLGLTLESSKGPQGFLVIDHVEKPTPNSAPPARTGGAGLAASVGALARIASSAAQSAWVALDPSQTPASAALSTQRFDAVSIKPCSGDPQLQPRAGGRGSVGVPVASPGRITMDCGTVEWLIKLAYITNGERLLHNNAAMAPIRPAGYVPIPSAPVDVVDTWWKGAPAWITQEKFSIEATAAGVTDRKILLGPMLRGLLEDHFKLKMHRDQADAPLYRMVVAKGGFKGSSAPCTPYEPASMPRSADESRAWNAKRWSGDLYECGIVSTTSGWVLGGQTMDDIATKVMPLLYVDRFVVDETGLTGKYNAKVTTRGSDGGRVDAFTAIEQWMGLKLEPTRGPQGFLVIDHIERPSMSGSSMAHGAGPRQ